MDPPRQLRDAPLPIALLLVDLEGLATVNDWYGFRIGDALLDEVHRRGTQVLGARIAIRVGSGKFAFAWPAEGDPSGTDKLLADRFALLNAAVPAAADLSPELRGVGGIVHSRDELAFWFAAEVRQVANWDGQAVVPYPVPVPAGVWPLPRTARGLQTWQPNTQ
jgi:GGDEF domain-containing protein